MVSQSHEPSPTARPAPWSELLASGRLGERLEAIARVAAAMHAGAEVRASQEAPR